MSNTERLTIGALAARLGAKPDSVRKRLIRIKAGRAKPWPWLAGVERSNSGEWVVLVDSPGLVPDLSRTSESHVSDLRAEVESARAQIADLIRLLDREISDRRAAQVLADQTREQLHQAQLAIAATESRHENGESRRENGTDWSSTLQQQAAAAEAMALQLARFWQVWWDATPVRTNGRGHDAP